ncbi:hypothetical protein QYM36_018812 [Artemia franciscana]|uniref:Methyltransferase n=1 Tax=Artemia franciscana TaxID=6661 RepID=A0AA88H8V0_ARTSF|nr:hypothetical protein QYM36_018812 [Artemia franciscana]
MLFVKIGEGWVGTGVFKRLDESEAFSGTINVEVELKGIAAELRKRLALDATLSSETIICPLVGPNSDCNATNTVHVDAFLYDDDLLDSLVEDGKLSRSYCKDCGSKNTSPLNFVSHSASIPRLRVIFQEILPDLTGKVVLDIGSRLGPVLYGAYYYSNAARIIGIEISQEFVQLQSQVVQGKGFTMHLIQICKNRTMVLEPEYRAYM